ncbi:MAG TPA: YdeI/OmpD-associated family protein [Haliangiales bacterium]|nr:YdeI/OmpD-associated family protein [Haliangiales bacterium]
MPQPRAFASAAEFRAWLARHAGEPELVVRLYKTHARARGMTYKEALDEALCFGWIDGVRRSIDADTFSVRFTPRKPKSYWSAVNIRRARELEAEGRMAPAGLAAFRDRAVARERYSFESRVRELGPAETKALRARARAWAYYQAQPPWYRRTSAFWVMSAKKAETRARRLAQLIAASEKGEPIGPLRRPGKAP